jgi:hypothetical protein
MPNRLRRASVLAREPLPEEQHDCTTNYRQDFDEESFVIRKIMGVMSFAD